MHKRYYRLKIRQIKDGDILSELKNIISNNNNCLELEREPVLKSNRTMPRPGVIWKNGVVSVVDDTNLKNCLNNFTVDICQNQVFDVLPVRLYNYNEN